MDEVLSPKCGACRERLPRLEARLRYGFMRRALNEAKTSEDDLSAADVALGESALTALSLARLVPRPDTRKQRYVPRGKCDHHKKELELLHMLQSHPCGDEPVIVLGEKFDDASSRYMPVTVTARDPSCSWCAKVAFTARPCRHARNYARWLASLVEKSREAVIDERYAEAEANGGGGGADGSGYQYQSAADIEVD